jgi:hypothetical protein
MPVAFPFLAETSRTPRAGLSHGKGRKFTGFLLNRLKAWAKTWFAALLRFPLNSNSSFQNRSDGSVCNPDPTQASCGGSAPVACLPVWAEIRDDSLGRQDG